MIGVSLPMMWLCGEQYGLGEVEGVLSDLKSHGVSHVELQTVCPDDDAGTVFSAARRLWREGFSVSVRVSPRTAETAVSDIFEPLRAFFDHNEQKTVILVLPPVDGDNVAMLRVLAEYAAERHYPVMLALENSACSPDGAKDVGASAVYAVVSEVNCSHVGICLNAEAFLHECSIKDGLPVEKDFFKRVVHTNVRADGSSLTWDEASWKALLRELCYGYFGVYNVELNFEGLDERKSLLNALLTETEAFRAALPPCAHLYEEIRTKFDTRFLASLDALRAACEGTCFSLIHSASYLFRTKGYHWGMDVAFRNAYRLAQTPHQAAELLSHLDLMIISHGHADHFEERTVRMLAENETHWVIPDFLEAQAIAWGIHPDRMTVVRAGEPVTVGPLTILPFPGRHFRPVTGKGTEEYGYHISAVGEPSLVFPVDTRDFSQKDLPPLPPADYCFANIWLGDQNSFAQDYGRLLEDYARFMLHFSDKHILLTHLYECNRRDEDMWRAEHARIVSRAIRALSPDTATITPLPGEMMHLS